MVQCSYYHNNVLISLLLLFISSLSTEGTIHSTIMDAIQSSTTTTTAATMKISHNDEDFIIGGGAINEKKRNNGNRYENHTNFEAREVESAQQETGCITNFDPQNKLSHLLHAVMGLDRYPNYLSRWNYNLIDDVQKLESALEEQLEKVRLQKKTIVERNEQIRSLIQSKQQFDNEEDNISDHEYSILSPPTTWQEIRDQILDPRASNAIFNSKMFQQPPTVQDVLDGKIMVELDAAQLEGWLDQEMFDVYSLSLLSKSFCIRLRKTIQKLAQLSLQTEQQQQQQQNPNNNKTRKRTIGTKPTDLDTIGASWINNLLFHLIIRPISKHLFSPTENFLDLDWRQGYILGYSHNPSMDTHTQRHKLVPHTDDSEVTLNIALSNGGGGGEGRGMIDEEKNFEGGDLVFWGLRGTKEEGEWNGSYQPRMGTALLHSGRHLHEVTEVTGGGDRFVYVVWSRSWESLRNEVCPCCWLNRRQNNGVGNNKEENRCMCNSRWN